MMNELQALADVIEAYEKVHYPIGMFMRGYGLIAAERQRQIEEEKWSANHDDQHGSSVLEAAALCYLNAKEDSLQPEIWPWASGWWKPKGHQRNLERAGALFQAAADVAERAGAKADHKRFLAEVAKCAALLDALNPPA